MFYSNAQIDPVNDYTYDALYRLIKAKGREKNDTVSFGSGDNWNNSPFLGTYSGSGSVALHNYEQQYSYDAVGNILQLKHIAPPPSPGNAAYSYTRDYEYYGNNNRLRRTTVDGGTSYYSYSHHTQHGYITALPHLPIMTWNFKEELVTSGRTSSSTVIPEQTYYQYDSKGKRLRKVTENQAALNSTPTLKNSRTYIEGYEFYKDYGSNEITHSLSLIDEGRRFVMIEDSNTYGYLVRYQHPNHQSSSSLETDGTGNVISYEEYHPFGTTAFQATNSTITSKAKRYRYTGMERDEETGLSYHSARYYISWLGRWLNPDPIGIGDGVNVYAYCGGNPVNGTDASGTQTTYEVEGRKLEDYENPPDFYDRLNEAGQNMFHNATQSFSKTINYNIIDGSFNVHFDVSILLNNQSGEASLDELVKALNGQEISTFDPERKILYSIAFTASVLGLGERANPNQGYVEILPRLCLDPKFLNIVGESVGGEYPVSANVYTYRPGEENNPVDWKESAITVIHEFLHPLGMDDIETQWDYKIPPGPEGMIGFTPGEPAIAPDVYIIPDSDTTYKSTGTTKMEYVRENLYNYAHTVIDGESFKKNSKPGQYLEKLSPDQMFILYFMISILMQKK